MPKGKKEAHKYPVTHYQYAPEWKNQSETWHTGQAVNDTQVVWQAGAGLDYILGMVERTLRKADTVGPTFDAIIIAYHGNDWTTQSGKYVVSTVTENGAIQSDSCFSRQSVTPQGCAC